jgi:hypothetical protein
MALSGVCIARIDRPVTPQGDRAVLGGCIEREDLHAAPGFYPGHRASV